LKLSDERVCPSVRKGLKGILRLGCRRTRCSTAHEV
jgi:hypothetical protein